MKVRNKNRGNTQMEGQEMKENKLYNMREKREAAKSATRNNTLNDEMHKKAGNEKKSNRRPGNERDETVYQEEEKAFKRKVQTGFS